MEKHPNITIIIANYNYGEHVGEAIDSAINQNYSGKITVCIINDGSTGDSWDVIQNRMIDPVAEDAIKGMYEILRSTASDGRDIIAINQENTGASIARNVGIEYCLDFTDAYCILDADDEYYNSKVKKLVEKWMYNPKEIGVVYADYNILNTKTGRILEEFKQPYNKEVLAQECIVHSNALISKEAFVTTREDDGEFYDSELHGPASGAFIGSCEDYDLWVRISEKFSITHIPECLGLAKITGNNQSIKANPQTFKINAEHMRKKAEDRRNAKKQ